MTPAKRIAYGYASYGGGCAFAIVALTDGHPLAALVFFVLGIAGWAYGTNALLELQRSRGL